MSKHTEKKKDVRIELTHEDVIALIDGNAYLAYEYHAGLYSRVIPHENAVGECDLVYDADTDAECRPGEYVSMTWLDAKSAKWSLADDGGHNKLRITAEDKDGSVTHYDLYKRARREDLLDVVTSIRLETVLEVVKATTQSKKNEC